MAEKKDFHSYSNDAVKSLDGIFKQAPHLPENIREVLVKIAPWLALVFGVLGVIGGVFGILVILGLTPVMALGGDVYTGPTSIFVLIVGLASSVLTLMAYPKLQKRQYRGWELLFWSELLSVVTALLAISLGTILGLILGFYLLFEMKGHYK